MKKWMVALMVVTAIIPLASGATIRGEVYDFSLNPVRAVVEINTTPKQKMITQEYEFQVDDGTYRITAEQLDGQTVQASTNETLTVKGNRTFTRDLILFPAVDVDEDLDVGGPSLDPREFDTPSLFTDKILPLLALLSILIVVWALHYTHEERLKMQKTKDWEESELDLDEDAQKVLEFVDAEKRVTQKQIREEFPYSQSKISLILTELEDKGLVKKIKRGRGNVVIRN